MHIQTMSIQLPRVFVWSRHSKHINMKRQQFLKHRMRFSENTLVKEAQYTDISSNTGVSKIVFHKGFSFVNAKFLQKMALTVVETLQMRI